EPLGSANSNADLQTDDIADAGEVVPPSFISNLVGLRTLHPGLSVVLVLVAVAALFSAGVWFGMRNHPADATKAEVALQSATPQPTPVSTSAISDHLMDPPKVDTGAIPLSASEGKLAMLPKVTGIRHWSTPIGSTVVIDMQDQVPYEVHRLMS